MRSHGVAALAVLIAVGLAGPAGAAITSSTITAPADGTHYLITDADPEHDVTVTGTSNGTTGDAVDIRCYDRADNWYGHTADNIPVAADGSFSTPVSNGDPYGTCILRAVPHGLASTSDPSPFSGPTLTTEWNVTDKVSGGPNDGKAHNFYVLFQGPNAMNDYVSATGGGLYDSRLSYAPGRSSTYLWYGNGFLVGNEHLSSANRSALQVDGRNAYGPEAAYDLLVNNPGLPSLTYDANRDTATGVTTIHETDPIVVCPSESPFPATALSCPHFDSAGVQLERTWVTDDGGRQVHMTDTWRSTDNNAHTLSLHYDQLLWARLPPQGAEQPVGLKLPWLGDFKTFTSDTAFPGPGPGMGTIFVRDNNNATDGDETFPVGAVSFDVAPTDVRWLENTNFFLRDETIAVPAGGTTVVRQDYVMGQTLAEVEAKATANVDRYSAPAVSISSPANGSSITGAASTKQVTVTGSASDNQGLASLTVNGASVPVTGGTFSVPATLALGSNTLTAVATDHVGLTATAAATVTYADNVAPAVTGFTASPRTFRVGAAATPVTARAARGTTFKFNLSENATVSINIARVVPGKRSGKRCVKPTKKVARAKSCQRLVSRGTLRRTLVAGKRSVKFTGRIGKRKLVPGRYVATTTAKDKAGNNSKKKTVKLRIVRR